MSMHVYELPFTPPQEVFSAFAEESHALFLDSADQEHPDARYSYIAVRPREVVRFDVESDHANPFRLVQDHLNESALCKINNPDLPPFQGGAAGYFGYDLGRTLEKLPDMAAKFPGLADMVIGLYDQVIAFDLQQEKSWIIVHAQNEDEADQKHKAIIQTCKRDTMNHCVPRETIEFTAQTPEHEYTQKIERIIEYIRAGDIFQANMTQCFSGDLPEGFAPYAHYLHLREINPAPFAGFMNAGDTIISSASPERFLCCTPDGRVETKPIKGTRPRMPASPMDKAMREALAGSAKDRAENTMIVDLLRNDLSKSCEAHSISVDKLCAIESFASVHHLVSTISGQLQKSKAPLDLLEGCFPGGSITGAPKIRAMEIIEELESQRRGPYCGALGYIGANGAMDTNILIRTLVYHGGKAYLNAGGGIVADSDPQGEYQESLDKAAAMLDSFQ